MVLAYHEITPKPGRYVYAVDRATFAQHLRYVRNLEASGRPQDTFALTFDDGHASHHRYGLPFLTEVGLKGIFFITAGWTGTRPEYMDWVQLREIAAAGHEIQSHGWSHAFLTKCGLRELEHELCASRATLEDHLGVAVRSISAPGGRWDSRVLEACRRAGYTRLYTSDPWLVAREESNLLLSGRFMVRRDMKPADLRKVLTSRHSRVHILRVRHEAKRLFRSLIGDGLYEQVWRVVGSSNSRSAINQEYLEARSDQETA